MNLNLALEIFEITSLVGQTESSLKKIYYQKAGIYHPDKGGSSDKFIQLREAYSLLKKALKDPNGNYQETQSSSNSNYDQNQGFEAYKQAYQDLQKTTQHYENIFNAQIKTVNNTADYINNLVQTHREESEKRRIVLEQQLANLEKQNTQNWFQYALNIKKISEQQYFDTYNQLIGTYNEEFHQREEEFNTNLLEGYRQGNAHIIDLLNQF